MINPKTYPNQLKFTVKNLSQLMILQMRVIPVTISPKVEGELEVEPSVGPEGELRVGLRDHQLMTHRVMIPPMKVIWILIFSTEPPA